MNRFALVSFSFSLVTAALALGPACSTSPLNGTAVSGSVVGKVLVFNGWSDEPGAQIRIQVMKDPTLNPSLASSWVQFAVATSSTSPMYLNDPDPLYAWTVSAAPVPNAQAAARWPQGGLARVRAVAPDNSVLTTFDAVTFNDCANQQMEAGASWRELGAACRGVAESTAAVVSTSNVPTGGFLSKKGKLSFLATGLYYEAIQAPMTLTGFKAKYGFDGTELKATYYNDGDLGVAREMHCTSYLLPGKTGYACYVSNYSSIAGQPKFGTNPTTALAKAIAHQGQFATVAMVAEPPFDAPNAVKFMVYDKNGNRTAEAQLDNTAENTSVPTSCMSCHGISSAYNAVSHSVVGAKFLPFDPFSFVYSTQAGYTFDDQAGAIRQLNALVAKTQPAPATLEYITGLYAPKAVTDPTAVANPSFVPTDWSDALEGIDGKTIYDGVVKVGCRTCHMSSTEPVLDFADASDFEALLPVIRTNVCGKPHTMPHAERVMKKFWESGARAYLVTGWPSTSYPDPLAACRP